MNMTIAIWLTVPYLYWGLSSLSSLIHYPWLWRRGFPFKIFKWKIWKWWWIWSFWNAQMVLMLVSNYISFYAYLYSPRSIENSRLQLIEDCYLAGDDDMPFICFWVITYSLCITSGLLIGIRILFPDLTICNLFWIFWLDHYLD